MMIISSSATGQAPGTFSYQGRLTATGGEPVRTTTDVTFVIYGSADGVDTLWSEQLSVVPSMQGIFTVELGAFNSIPSGVFDGSTRYLGLRVESDASEMTPRQVITSVPYAMRAGNMPGIATSYLFDATVWDTAKVASEVTVTVPGPGFIDVRASGYFNLDHIFGFSDWVQASVGTLPDVADSMYKSRFALALDNPFGLYSSGFCIERVIKLAEGGTYTYYLNADRHPQAGVNTSLSRVSLTATYYPQAIGQIGKRGEQTDFDSRDDSKTLEVEGTN